ncbi:hypothetical protein HY793_02535 [Candidatus Desantisbacteria bacterium]|nr:hypothetical protein [Candidatus Desantisbacteria bacterium]
MGWISFGVEKWVNFERKLQGINMVIRKDGWVHQSGELVYDKTQATTNGRVVWMCENNNGDKVASGVYLYILTNPVKGERVRGKGGVVK